MFLQMIRDDRLAQNAWLVGCQKSGEAIIIDPERDIDRYIEIAARNRLRIVASLETHIHADFLSGSRQLARDIGARPYLSDEGGRGWTYQWGGDPESVLLRNNDTFTIGAITFQALHTPGHTPEHISVLVTDAGHSEPMGVLTGDFVFVGDLGRPDLLETAAGVQGDAAQAAKRLRKSALDFLSLPDHLQVWPAHGAGSACGKSLGAVPQSTVGYERRFNPALRLASDEDAFVQAMLADQPEPPLYFARMKTGNRDGPALLDGLPESRRLGKSDLEGLENITIIDTRPWPAFCAGHLPGSLWMPLGTFFATAAPSYVSPDREICLVAPQQAVDECVRMCVRVGLDRISAWVEPSVLEEALSAGLRAHGCEDIQPSEAMADRAKGVFVLDVRGGAEYRSGHIAGATHVPYARLPDQIEKLPKKAPIIVHCASGVRSAMATSLLQSRGLLAANLAGGIMAWRATGGQVEK